MQLPFQLRRNHLNQQSEWFSWDLPYHRPWHLLAGHEIGSVLIMRTDRRFVPSSHGQYDDAIQMIVWDLLPASSRSDKTGMENDILTCGTTLFLEGTLSLILM